VYCMIIDRYHQTISRSKTETLGLTSRFLRHYGLESFFDEQLDLLHHEMELKPT
jgi:hypothetical protein